MWRSHCRVPRTGAFGLLAEARQRVIGARLSSVEKLLHGVEDLGRRRGCCWFGGEVFEGLERV